MIYTTVDLAQSYGLELAIFAQRIFDCSFYSGVEVESGRWIFANTKSLRETLFPFWSIKQLRTLCKEAEDMKLIRTLKELEGHEKSGQGLWITVDYKQSPFSHPTFGDEEVEEGLAEAIPETRPTRQLVEWWNENFASLGKVLVISPTRSRKIKLRIKEGMLDSLELIKKNILTSEFLNGKELSWTANFDWLIGNDTNWLKIAEGRYNNNKSCEEKRKTLAVSRESVDAMKEKMKGGRAE